MDKILLEELPVSSVPDSSFSPADLRQMAELGIAPAEALRQIELFRNPPPFTRVLRACRVGDGIRRISKAAEPWLLARFEEAVRRGRIAKLVPASGAATRMFKELLADLNDGAQGEPPPEVRIFLDSLPHFAFYEDLSSVQTADRRTILEYLLTEKGLNYAELPKGLLKFHRYPDGPRTPFEEHLVEAADVTRDEEGNCRLHFTVSPQRRERFEALLEEVRGRYEARYNCRFDVSFSHQQRSTDTIAVDPENRPFRQDDGTLLFRPGGHGALLDNLAGLGWDIVLLKNIDNVVPDGRKPLVNGWKKALSGYLLALQERIFRLQERLEADPAALEEASKLVEEELSRPIPAGLEGEARRQFVIEALNRPLRVCGVVRNQGEPGGGPFWIEDERGQLSLQIVESSQIDPKTRQEMLAGGTHFNPVDIVCALRDRHGAPYDLHRFVDPTTVFISSKSHEGRPLKALERPGLWNGAMAGWNTVFVEVPDETFAPVKTVLDLLRPEHQ
ncbi:MAG: hypothetical protein QOH06_198 [Acidobacteriota bacterium]|jgi:hypothetical protein|nr:hypothetical protein [Acidobacteriota bacterium]